MRHSKEDEKESDEEREGGRKEGQKDLRMEKKFAQGSERGFGACLARSLGALLWQYIRSIRSAAWRLSALSHERNLF